MIWQVTTMEHSRCDACGGPGENPDVAEVITFNMGPTRYQAVTVRLCNRCVERDLLRVVAPWASTGCLRCGVGRDDECSMDCPSR